MAPPVGHRAPEPIPPPAIEPEPTATVESAPEPPPPEPSTAPVAPVPPEPETVFTRYPDDGIHSPITVSVVRSMRAIHESHPDRAPQVFIKVGASETVNRRYLRCFSDSSSSPFVVDLGEHQHLAETLDYFRGGQVARRCPFTRTSRAAKVGHSTSWVIAGKRSPLVREIFSTNPAWALVSFGTNDLNLGKTPRDSLWPYYRNLATLMDQTIAAGVVPIVMGTGPRADSRAARRWSPMYNTVARAIAEQRQVPFTDIYHATDHLEGHALVRDGIHGNGFMDPARGNQPCIFSAEGLRYHYNVRNLVTLQALDRARRGLEQNLSEADDLPLPPVTGDGSRSTPFVIDRLPFTHVGDTSASAASDFDEYTGCDSSVDVSGPELVYRLDIEESTALRLLVLYHRGVDVDLYLLGESPTAAECRSRHGRIIEATLEPGTYHVVLDTAVSDHGRAQAGEYLFVAMTCADDDRDCSSAL